MKTNFSFVRVDTEDMELLFDNKLANLHKEYDRQNVRQVFSVLGGTEYWFGM